jgi:hypothetical protein
MPTQPEGFFDGVGGKSSKRLQSFLGLVAALVFPLVAALLKLEGKLPVGEITTAFLVYSAALQGVSYIQEQKLLNGRKR